MTLVLGIDAGGTKIAAGIVDVSDGRLLEHLEIASGPGRGGDAILADTLALARRLTVGWPVATVGLGVPELVSRDGEIRSAANWDWRDFDLPSAFAMIAPVKVEADVRAAAIAEARLGAGKGLSSFLYLNVGTGISHTLVIDGSPWRGARGNALVVGAPPIETLASGSALAARTGKPRAEDVLDCDSDQAVVDEAADVVANGLAVLVNALDPEAVVIGGGLGLAGGFQPRIAKRLRDQIYAEATRNLAIRSALLGARAGVIGAALAAAPTA